MTSTGAEGKGIPLLGEKFPEMEIQTTHGKAKLSSDYAGKWFVLFSHPGDFTPVCTTEFVAFAKRQEQFRKLNAELIGLSVDQVFSHTKWVEWIKEKLGTEIEFPVIADASAAVSAKLGMIHPGKGANTVRAVFIVDPNGVIRWMVFYPQEIGRNIDEVVRALTALQISDKNKIATPANWPNNELLGDRVIVPPVTDEKMAKDRLKNFECYDWWFCHRKL